MTNLSTVTPVEQKTLAAGESAALIDAVINAVGEVVLGKDRQIRLALCCLLAKGHLLIEDLPGMGKTTLSHTLGAVLGLSYQRLQFTSDLLPSDILGASIYDKSAGNFQFVKGPIFTQLLLADEVNRATPKTQSALLEAMEERQVSIDGQTHSLPEPFFVIATQNPGSQSGTYPLPESQLDRFLMKVSLGYPDSDAERQLLKQSAGNRADTKVNAVLDKGQLQLLQEEVGKVKTSDVLLDYLQRLIDYSRTAPDFVYGISPRGALSILQAAKSWAFIHNRHHVLPEDIQLVLPVVASHRLDSQTGLINAGQALVAEMLDAVDVLK